MSYSTAGGVLHLGSGASPSLLFNNLSVANGTVERPATVPFLGTTTSGGVAVVAPGRHPCRRQRFFLGENCFRTSCPGVVVRFHRAAPLGAEPLRAVVIAGRVWRVAGANGASSVEPCTPTLWGSGQRGNVAVACRIGCRAGVCPQELRHSLPRVGRSRPRRQAGEGQPVGRVTDHAGPVVRRCRRRSLHRGRYHGRTAGQLSNFGGRVRPLLALAAD